MTQPDNTHQTGTTDAMNGLSILIPAFNEENAIQPTLEAISKAMAETGRAFEIIVIDDGSSDRTADRVSGDHITLLRHPTNRGYGASLKTGLRKARYPLVAITDADGTYPNHELPRLLAEMGDADMIVGERSGGGDANESLIRRIAKGSLCRLAGFMVGQQIPDINSGFRIFKRDIALEFMSLYPPGFSFTSTITVSMMGNDYLVKYTPIEYYRREGQSKIRPVRDFYNFIVLILRTVMYYNPLKVFVPASLLLLIAGIVRGLYNVTVYENLTTADLLLIETGVLIGALGLLADLIAKRS